jgi:hypothetical protein
MTVITTAGLNRALLARQLLLDRHEMSALQAVEHLVGLQAQAPFPPYFGLWSRLAGFRPQELAGLLEGRQVVRIVLMRGTVHLVSAADALMLRPLTQPLLDRYLAATRGKRLTGLDLAAVVAAGRDILDTQGALTGSRRGALLAERFEASADDLAHVMRVLAPLVQVPPRAVWGRSGQTAYATLESWLGCELPPVRPVEELVVRYLAAFGPATVADVQAWSGLTGLREAVERLRPDLVELRDENGRTLYDLPDAPRPPADTPAPVRLVAPFDNLLLSHADRTRVIADAHRKQVITVNGQVLGTVLVDGFVRGTWKRDGAVLSVEMFEPVGTGQAEQIRAEAAALLEFAEPGGAHEIRGI